MGIYAGVDIDFTEKLLVSVAGRYEDYSDAGDNFSWKLASRYKLSGNNNCATCKRIYRTSTNTTPTKNLLTRSTLSFLDLQNLYYKELSKTVRQRHALGIQDLTNETSQNFTAGITFGNGNGFSGSLDFYNIKVNDRTFTSQIEGDAANVNTPGTLATTLIKLVLLLYKRG